RRPELPLHVRHRRQIALTQAAECVTFAGMLRLPRWLTLAAAAALLPACIINGQNTTDSTEYVCDDPNSYLEGDRCLCDPGYEFCTTDPDDLTCCVSDAPTTVGPTSASVS